MPPRAGVGRPSRRWAIRGGSPDNLDEPLATTDRERGGFGGRSWSLATWGQLHPHAVWGAIAAAAGATLIATRLRR